MRVGRCAFQLTTRIHHSGLMLKNDRGARKVQRNRDGVHPSSASKRMPRGQRPKIRFVENIMFESRGRFTVLLENLIRGPTLRREADRMLHILITRSSAYATPRNESAACAKFIIASTASF